MKGVLVIMDGLGDLPHDKLNGMTPLEAAETPNLDFLATRGEMGYMDSVKPNFVPESDEAIVCIFGNDLISSTRGQLEARGAGLKLTRGDLALRVNFATIKGKEIIDRRAGRNLTTDEAEILSRALNEIKLPCKFEFVPTVQHRGVLVLRGGFSDDFSGNDLTYVKGKAENVSNIGNCKPFNDEDNARYTTNILNEFLEKAHEVLINHPVNRERREKGFLPANYLFVRGGGIEVPKLKQYKKWISITNMPLEMGFSHLSGMNVFELEYPRLKNFDAYENMHNALAKICKFSIKVIKKNLKSADYVYLHIKETDLPGHDNKPFEKKQMIEYVDKTLFKFLRRIAPPKEIKVVVTADHSTPCKMKAHSADPVPVLYYNNGEVPEVKQFSEKEARKGRLGRITGKALLKKVGFAK